MSKTELTYERVNDGVRPGVAPYGAVVRLPIEIKLEQGRSMALGLGVRFDRTCLSFIHGDLLRLHNEGQVDFQINATPGGVGLIPAETEVVLWLHNKGDRTVSLAEKQAVLDVIPLPDVDVTQRK